MKNRKIFSVLEIKSTDDNGNKRTFKGIASTITPDRDNDIVNPKGVEYKLPLPFLWQHNQLNPIGHITKVKINDSNIEVEGEVANIKEEGSLKTRIDEVWQMLKEKLVRGLSIGYKVLEYTILDETHGWNIIKWEWLELSAVTIPANIEANIVSIKTAFGKFTDTHNKHNSPGVTGCSDNYINFRERSFLMKTATEQFKELREARAVKAARLNEINELIKEKTATNDDSQEFDSLVEEIKELDDQIRMKWAEILSAKSATPINPSVNASPRAPFIIMSKTIEERELEEKDPKKIAKQKGLDFTRVIIAKALSQLDQVSALAIAQKRWGKDRPLLTRYIKAAVAGGGTGTGEWGEELVSADSRYTGDFIDLLTGDTVYDKLPLREIPANVLIKGRDGAATGYWVGESKAIPVSAQSFNDVTLKPLKVGALAVITNELLRDSSPAAEGLVRNQLVEASRKRIDETFLSANAADANVSPAGILNGVTAESASGTDADSLLADLKTLYNTFIAAKNASGLYIVMSKSLAKSIQFLRNALGQKDFPDITQNGGSLEGDPVVTGDHVASDDLILLKPSDIYKIGDTGVSIEISREASIEMESAPAMDTDTPTAASGALVSMFQTESTAIKVVRSINFAKRRTGVVQYIGDAAYDNSSS